MREIPMDRICPKSSSLSDPAFQLDPIVYLFESFIRSFDFINSKCQTTVDVAKSCQTQIFKQLSLCLLLDAEMDLENCAQSLLNLLLNSTHVHCEFLFTSLQWVCIILCIDVNLFYHLILLHIIVSYQLEYSRNVSWKYLCLSMAHNFQFYF